MAGAGGARWLWLAAAALVLLAPVLVRWPATPWAIDTGQPQPRIVETDESTFYRHYVAYPHHRPVYVDQTTMHALLLKRVVAAVARLRGQPVAALESPAIGYRIGRCASIVASLALLLLVLLGGAAFGLRSRLERTLAAGLLALSPLLSVYGHLFLADALNVFWIYLGCWVFLRFAASGNERLLLLFAAIAGFATATKFSTTYFLVPGVAMLLRARRPLALLPALALIAAGAFWLGNGFNYGPEQLQEAGRFLRFVQAGEGLTLDVAANLRRQGAYVVAALGLPTTLLLVAALLPVAAALRAYRRRRVLRGAAPRAASVAGSAWARVLPLLRRPARLRYTLGRAVGAQALPIVVAGLLLQLAIFATSGVGGFFARHVIPFVPLLVFGAVRSLTWLLRRPGYRVAAALLLLGYQLVLCLDGERAYYADPRQAARAWIERERPAQIPIFADFYAQLVVAGLPHSSAVSSIGPSPIPPWRQEHYFVTHQATYGRYLLADACAEILHCLGGPSAHRFFRRLLAGELEGYRLVHVAKPGYVMPEHRLLRWAVPTHPFPEVGEVRIYHVSAGAEPHG
ncbi:MAG: hypothetical protein IPL40_08075 [Proteobacteria bacterium]|nr:hypothetical protein [Pseudomonadota bacterium]